MDGLVVAGVEEDRSPEQSSADGDGLGGEREFAARRHGRDRNDDLLIGPLVEIHRDRDAILLVDRVGSRAKRRCECLDRVRRNREGAGLAGVAEAVLRGSSRHRDRHCLAGAGVISACQR